MYLVVVVNSERRFIITAYLATRMKMGELEWKRD